jgi:PPOX class probable F420-dependent enzyme
MPAQASQTLQLSEREEALLKAGIVLWFGSTRPDGRPHIVPVWFSWNGDSFFFVTQPECQKVKNIKHDPRVTVALDDTIGGHDAMVFEGIASLEPEQALTAMPPEYVAKYEPRLTFMKESVEDLTRVYSQVVRVRPTRYFEG